MSRVRHSNFLVTINTNVRPTADDIDDLASSLDGAIQEFLTPDGLRQTINVLEPNVRLNRASVRDVEAEYAIEVGEKAKGGRVHAHCIIKVSHTTKIRMDGKKITELITSQMDSSAVKNVYVNIKLLNTGAYAEDYIRKKAFGSDSNNNSNSDVQSVSVDL